LLAKHDILKFDFAKINSVNSAGLALLLEWRRYATLKRKTITFSNMPDQLVSIATVAGVSDLFQ
jgi:phospholipid transport system transporter-binding protein